MRQLGRLGVWYPIDRLDAGGIRRLLRTIEDLGYSTFWYPEALGYESLSIASFMLANTERLIIGSSIANIYARDPFTARRGLRHYMAMTNYRNNWLRIGFSEPDLADGGSDKFIDAMVLWGDAATIARGLTAHLQAGANQVCIQPIHAEGDMDARDRTLSALAGVGALDTTALSR